MILDKAPLLEDCTTVVFWPSGLAAIQQPACATTIWQRAALPGFQHWINTLPPEQLPKARMLL